MATAKKSAAKKSTASAPKADATAINNTFGGSAVTTNLGGSNQPTEETNRPKTFLERASDASIGEIRLEGQDFRYIGIAPARDKNAKTPGGIPITTENSRFIPLSEVPFDARIRVKIGDEYFYPDAQATGWADVNLNGKPLVPAE